MHCQPGAKLCVDCLRAWLDRPCPPRDVDREFMTKPDEEWELRRVAIHEWSPHSTADSLGPDAAPQTPATEAAPDVDGAAHAAHA